MKHFIWVGCLALMSASIAQAVPIHKWVDSTGNVHYSNVPPVASNAKTLVLEYKGVGNTSSITKKEAPKVEEKIDPEILKKIADEKEMSRQNCIRSKEGLQMLESGVRVSRINTKGEKENIDDQGRIEEMVRAKKAIKDWCSE